MRIFPLNLKVKNRFWIPAILFSIFFAGVTLAGGLYLLTFQENERAKAGVKKNLRRHTAGHLKNLENRLSHFQREAKRLIDREGGASPLFAAFLPLGDETPLHQSAPAAAEGLEGKDSLSPIEAVTPRKGNRKEAFDSSPLADALSRKKGLSPFSSAPIPSEKLMRDFLVFVDSLKKVSSANSAASLHFLPPAQSGEEGWMVFSAGVSKELGNLRWAALIRNSDVFSFLKASDREALIINSQGRLFFSFHPQAAVSPPSQPVLRKLLKAGGKTSGRFVRLKGGDFQTNNFFHIKPLPETNLFVITGARFLKGGLVWPEGGVPWLGFCLGLFALLFLGLLFVIRPLARLPRRLKAVPFTETPVSPSPSPALFPAPRSGEDPLRPFPSFQDLLREEEKHLREKFPGFILKTRLETNINITYFYRPLKKILRELILNGIESMGGAAIQEITVSAREKGGKFILSVRDRGPGLNPREKVKAFNLYYSTKSHLGVGLNVVQSLVSFHGGELKISSLSEEDSSQAGLKVQVSFPVGCFSLPQEVKGTAPLRSAREETNEGFRRVRARRNEAVSL